MGPPRTPVEEHAQGDGSGRPDAGRIAAGFGPVRESPATPSRSTVASVTYNSVTITLTDPGDSSITGNQVLRRNPAIHDRLELAVIEDDMVSSGTSYSDTSVAPETRYIYHAKARNAHGLSSWSKVAKATTSADPTPPNAAPSGLLTIAGTAQVGETLSAGKSGITDANGLTGVQYGYQWVRSDGNADTNITSDEERGQSMAC